MEPDPADPRAELRSLVAEPCVRRARALVHRTDSRTLSEQVELARIPAPPLGEAERAARFRALLVEMGCPEPRVDAVGNVVALLPASSGESPPLLVAAHLDSVFSGDRRSPRWTRGRVHTPGITDNARGLAAVLALVRVLIHAKVRTRRPVVFAATVGEEGAGDLRGVKHLFRADSPFRHAHAFVALDGAGVRRIVHRAVGSRRLRCTVHGPGGHSWTDRGAPNPIRAIAAAIAATEAGEPDADPPVSLIPTRMGGGTSINAVPEEAWVEWDLRSEHPASIERTEARLRAAFERAVAEQNRARSRPYPALRSRVEVIGDRPAGSVPADCPAVRAAVAATRLLGEPPQLAASSTDANVPIALGIPSVALGAGGSSGGVHTPGEWYDNRGGPLGIERALLTVLLLAGVETGE